MDEEVKEIFVDEEAANKFCQQTATLRNGLSRVQPCNFIVPSGRYSRFQKNIEEFEVYEDDVWVGTYMKAGTTWMTEIVWCLLNNLDFEKAKSITMNDRIPFFEWSLFEEKDLIDENNLTFDAPKHLKRPRTIKTHLHYDLLPKQVREKKVKIVNVIRNPRDVCLSILNHFKIWDKYEGDLETLVDMFLKDAGPYNAPFFSQVLGYWKHKDDPNMLILFYEDMKKDLRDAIKKVAKFLEVNISDDDVEKLHEHCSFDSMKANPSVNRDELMKKVKEKHGNTYEGQFMNKGKSGGWKNKFDDATIKRFEEWEAKWLKDTGLKFDYEA